MTDHRHSRSRPRSRHIAPLLEDLVLGNASMGEWSSADLDRMARHLAGCGDCRATLAVLEEMLEHPAFVALRAHSADPATIPDEATLADYALVSVTGGEAAARERFPQWVAHIDACPQCQEEIVFAAEAIREEMAIQAKVVPVPASTVPSAPSPWHRLADGAQRLIAGFAIGVRQLAVDIINAPDHAALAATNAAMLGLLDSAASAQIPLSQVFTLDLRDNSRPDSPWIQVEILLRALPSKRLSFRLRARAFTSAADTSGETAEGVAWSLVRADAPGEGTVKHGLTNDAGQDETFLDPSQFGDYLLVFDIAGQRWEVPLLIADEVQVAYDHAMALLAASRAAEALEALHAALAIDHTFAPIHVGLGRTLMALGRPEEARAALKRAVNMRPDDAESWIWLGYALADLQRLQEAKIAFERAAALEPNNVEAWQGLGDTLFAQRRLAEAQAAYHRAIALDPQENRAWSRMGTLPTSRRRSAPRIFISHAHDDSAFVRLLANTLRSQGKDVWYDEGGYLGGDSWLHRVQQVLEQAQVFLLVLSPRATRSPWVQMETNAFLTLRARDPGRLLLPIRLGDTKIPPYLQSFQWIDAVARDIEGTAEAIVHAIKGIAVAVPAAAQPMTTPDPAILPPRMAALGFELYTFQGIEAIVPPLVTVPPGSFLMGSDEIEEPGSVVYDPPQRQVTLPAYQIGMYPVTVAEYACAVRVRAVPPPSALPGKPTERVLTWEDQLRHLDHPVIAVSWFDAQRYTQWLMQATGQPYRLPTEAEWEKAARGTDGRRYPWGDQKNQQRTLHNEGEHHAISPIGLHSENQSPFGCQHMAGVVWQWTSDQTTSQTTVRFGGDPNELDAYRVARGGTFAGRVVPVVRRNIAPPLTRLPDLGFRLASDIPGGG